MKQYSDVIIGSGPTGFAAALGAVRAGRRPAIIDFGSTAPRTTKPKQSLATRSAVAESSCLNYPETLVTNVSKGPVSLSSARGGQSLAWGAGVIRRGVMEFPSLETIWPEIDVGYSELDSHLALAGDNDALNLRFPGPFQSSPSPASRRFMEIRNQASNHHLYAALIGTPRVAMNTSLCVRCGLCLAGCPESVFFRADVALQNLRDIDFLEGGPVIRLDRQDDGTVLIVTPRVRYCADRVFLAAGPIGTPALLQRSGMADPNLVVHDSALFYFALRNSHRPTGDEAEYSAAQLIMYSRTANEDDYFIAIHESSSEFGKKLGSLIGVKTLQIPKWVLGRLNAAVGFLPTSQSGHLSLITRNNRTSVRAVSNGRTRQAAREKVRKIRSDLVKLGLYPMVSTLSIPPAGAGFHSGGTFPIGEEHVNLRGEWRSFPAVLLVDATALPEIHPGPHTYTAMANAFRTAFFAAAK